MPAEEENNKIQPLQENTTLREDKTQRVKQAFCKGNNKIQQLREDMCRTEFPAEEGKQPIQHLQENTTLREDKTLRVKQAFCKGNNKYNSFAWTVIS